MRLKLLGGVSATMLAWALAIIPASAGPITYNFYTLGGSPGTPGALLGGGSGETQATFGALSVASVYDPTEVCTGGMCSGGEFFYSSNPLFIKNGNTSSEQGLGLYQDPYGNYEITNPNGIMLTSSHPFTSVTIGSLQSGEDFQILDVGPNGFFPIYSGSGLPVTQTFSISGALDYTNLIIWDPSNAAASDGSNNILLLSVSTVPEPGTLALLAAGLAALGFAVTRRKLRTNA